MQPKLLVQSLQGARAQILFAFLFAGHAMDVDELSTWTGKMRQTHYGHLATLCGAGLLAKQTVAHGRDVYLLGSEMLPALQSWVAQIGSGNPELGKGAPALQESRIMTPGRSLIVFNPPFPNIEDSVLNNNNKTQESRIMTPGDQVSDFRTPDEFSALLEALAKYKIVGQKKAELIACEWVTAEYVSACVEYAQAEGLGKHAVGTAILRMLDHMDQPAHRENGHMENCECADCKETLAGAYARYRGGAFSDYFGNYEIPDVGCMWQDETEEVFGRNHPLAGEHLKLPRCKKSLKPGSDRWCEEHYEIGVQTYDRGAINQEDE